jgi:ribosomal protein S18 acetylase RimI-like enzyme
MADDLGLTHPAIRELWRMEFTIESYRTEFQDAVVDLWRKCGLIVPQNDPFEDIKRKVEFQPELFFIGLLNGEVVGSILAGYEGHRGWINYLAVNPEFQRRGYGRKLVEKAIDELNKLGCPKINIQVRRSNLQVIDFYKHLGFKEDDVTSFGLRLKRAP